MAKIHYKPYCANNFGFTLTEIMVTLAIIGILSFFSIEYLFQRREKAQLAMAEAMLAMYAQELNTFQLKIGALPSNEEEYNIFVQQLKLDPSKDRQYKNYFKIEPDFENKYLFAKAQEAHQYNSYAKMDLSNFSIYVCKNTQKNQNVQDNTNCKLSSTKITKE